MELFYSLSVAPLCDMHDKMPRANARPDEYPPDADGGAPVPSPGTRPAARRHLRLSARLYQARKNIINIMTLITRHYDDLSWEQMERANL